MLNTVALEEIATNLREILELELVRTLEKRKPSTQITLNTGFEPF